MSEGLSFEELLRRVRAGDQAAARELVQRYEPTIRRAVRFRLSDGAWPACIFRRSSRRSSGLWYRSFRSLAMSLWIIIEPGVSPEQR